MPKLGEVEVLTSRSSADGAARWLSNVYRAAPETALGGGLDNQAAVDGVANLLTRAAKRRRNSVVFSINISRASASIIVAIVDGYVISRQLPTRPMLRFAQNVRKALALRAGRPRLTVDRKYDRVQRTILVEERHRKRTAKALRSELAWAAWMDRLHARGETVMTSSEPPPNI
jgi:hypothetical protein